MACGDADVEEAVVEQEVVPTTEILERAEKAQLVFKTIPSPLETVTLFKEAGVGYNSNLTSPVENVRNYTESAKKAINLGVYGADLSFANMFDQTQESMFFMNCAKILADGLGVTSAFSVETMERLETNMNNRDSLLILVNDAFWITDAHLKENGQDHISTLIIAGGWVEGLYIGASSINPENPSKAMMQRVADQKYSLNNLIELLDTFENEDLITFSNQLKELQKVYDKIGLKKGKTSVKNNGGSYTIAGGNELTFDSTIIAEITAEIKKIRNEIIQ